MKTLIKQFNVKNEYYTSEKCFITEISNSTDDPASPPAGIAYKILLNVIIFSVEKA